VKANAKVAENLYRKATGDGRESIIAAIFWLKTRAGWKETSVQELNAGKDNQVVPQCSWLAISTRRQVACVERDEPRCEVSWLSTEALSVGREFPPLVCRAAAGP